MNEDWLDRHGHHVGFAWLAVVLIGGYVWASIRNGWWDVTLGLLQAVGVFVVLIGSFIAIFMVVDHYDRGGRDVH